MPRSISPRPTIAGASVEVASSLPVELVAAVVSIARQKDEDKPWMVELTGTLGEERVKEIVRFCRPLRHGMDLVEFTADTPAGSDAETFFEFIAGLSDRELTYYLLGRLYAMEQIPEVVSEQSVTQLLRETDTADSAYHEGAGFGWADDVSATRQTIIGILRSVWEGYLEPRLEEIQTRWQDKARELNAYIERKGALALWQLVADSDELPMEIPAGHPYTLVRFVPSCLTSFGLNYVFGFGKVIVVFSCEKSLQDAEDLLKATEDSVVVLKALCDRNRLRLLRLVAKGRCEINGKQMAEVLKLSPSVVSRHLAQLRAAGLIEEHTKDNRNITYTLRPEPIDRLSASITEYISQVSHG